MRRSSYYSEYYNKIHLLFVYIAMVAMLSRNLNIELKIINLIDGWIYKFPWVDDDIG